MNEETKRKVNLWDETLTLAELQELIAMIIDLKGHEVVKGVDSGELWIQLKGTRP